MSRSTAAVAFLSERQTGRPALRSLVKCDHRARLMVRQSLRTMLLPDGVPEEKQ